MNNPVRYTDPDGRCPTCPMSDGEMEAVSNGEMGRGLVQSVTGTVSGLWNAVTSRIETLKGIGNAIAHPIATGEAIVNSVKAEFSASPQKAMGNALGGAILAVVGAEAVQAIKTSSKVEGVVASSQKSKGVFQVTKEGVVLPKGKSIPAGLSENPFNPKGTSSFGKMENGKFVEGLRIDPATAPGKRGPNYSHYHKDGKKTHYSPNGKDKNPGF